MSFNGLLGVGFVLLLVSPLSAQLDFDNFDSYAVGSFIAGQGAWDTWDQAPGVDAEVTDNFAFSLDNSLELQPGDDIVRLFNGINASGALTSFSFTSQIYVPSGQAGTYYFILLNTYNHNGPKNWSVQLNISDATGLVSDAGGSSAPTGTSTPVPVVYDAWVPCVVNIDLAANTYDAFYNGQIVMSQNTWSGAGGQAALECLDLYNAGGGIFYYDDVGVDCNPSPCPSCLPFDSMSCDMDCATNDVVLNWTTFMPPTGYSGGINVLRNGTLIASLPGTATTYTDLAAPAGALAYEVVGDCGGGSTFSATCNTGCTDPCPPPVPGDSCCDAIPAVQGANAYDDTGATLSVDAYDDSLCPGTFLGDMEGDLWFSYTSTTDTFLQVSTCAGTVDTDLVLYEAGPTCGQGTIVACSGDVNGLCGLGSEVIIPTIAGTNYLIRVGRWGAAVVGGPNTLTVQEICEPAFVGLGSVLDCATTDVTLTWDPATFDTFDVYRDGAPIATGLAAGTNTYVDLSVGNGLYDYEVVANCANGTSLAQQLPVTVAGAYGVSDLIFRGEGAGSVDSVAAIDAALQAAGITATIIPGGVDNVLDLPCLDDPVLERVWVCLGSFPANRALSALDGQSLVTLQANGVHIYLEAGDAWGFDAPTDFALIDGVADGIADGGDGLLSLTGANTTLGLDTSDLVGISYYQDAQAGNDWTDELVVSATDLLGPNAAILWGEAAGAFNVGTYYDTDSGGKVICGSWEFGGFAFDGVDPLASEGARADLMSRYLTVFGFGPPPPVGDQFKRGDSNADGSVNIADAIYILSVLFPSGTPPVVACDSALDANDDGGLNIADAISLLGVLFPSSSPAPTIPEPVDCGVDPTADSLTCGPFAPCP